MVCLLANDLPNQCVVLQDSRNQVTSQHFPSSHSKCFLKLASVTQSYKHCFLCFFYVNAFYLVFTQYHTQMDALERNYFLCFIILELQKNGQPIYFLFISYPILSFEMNIFPSKQSPTLRFVILTSREKSFFSVDALKGTKSFSVLLLFLTQLMLVIFHPVCLKSKTKKTYLAIL